ncbi:MAG TPA: cytochrome c family protein [Caulobacteraceae bacterium]
MRTVLALLSLALVTACSPSTSTNTAKAAAESPEPSPPPALTAAQKTKLLAGLPPAYRTADLDNGQDRFAICKTCHTTAKGAGDMTGPNLWGVFGRKAGTEPGYAYSDGMKSLGVTWDANSIDRWISNPKAMNPATKMTYIGMQNPKDRIDLIAYLKTITSPPPA